LKVDAFRGFLISRLKGPVYLYIRGLSVINTPQRNFETFPTFSKYQNIKISKEKNLKISKSQKRKISKSQTKPTKKKLQQNPQLFYFDYKRNTTTKSKRP